MVEKDDGSPCQPWCAFGGMMTPTPLQSNARTKVVNKITQYRSKKYIFGERNQPKFLGILLGSD